MQNISFLSFEGGKLLSHVKIYENESNHKIHLIPIVHIGTKDYFHNIVEYVGDDIPCIYESMGFASNGDESHNIKRNLDDLIEFYSNEYDLMWKDHDSFIKKFHRKYTSKELKKVLKLIRQEAYKSNKKIIRIYELCNKTNFSLINGNIIQIYWCEILRLEHQMMAIDYEIDIPNRSNWVRADLNFKLEQNKTEQIEKILEVFKNPTQTVLDEIEKERSFIMGTLINTINLSQMNKCSQRRKEFAKMTIDTMTTQYHAFENVTPEYLIKQRNIIVEEGISTLLEDFDEVAVFYGAVHMIGIEKYLFNKGFKVINQKCYEVFDINT